MAVRHSRAVQRLASATRPTESRLGRIGPISLDVKQMGERSAGNPHAAFDAEGANHLPLSTEIRCRFAPIFADQERLKQFLSFAWASFAPLPTDTILEGSGWPSLNSTAKAIPRLEMARAALNSYVHPNYGSHIAALFPERSSAARLLLEAVVGVYEAFFALSWSEKPISGLTLPLGIVRRLRIFGQRDKLKADRSKGA